ncbi:MAG: Gfo/Idh/MocA family oxidoreductase [Phaeodactylibacter sp.]|nr:Gfo/Idh/MocA family oxidoreductase [Phaeodactylibacter sp.]
MWDPKLLIRLLPLSLLFIVLSLQLNGQDMPEINRTPVKIGIIGLEHSHVHWLLGRPDRGDLEIVGIVEADEAVWQQYASQYKLSDDLHFTELEKMLKKAKPEGVCVFTSIDKHLPVVEACAKKGIHVLLEKPTALNAEEVRQMQEAARKRGILILTNYETSFYGSVNQAFKIANVNEQLGKINKIVVQTGHQGPKEIGVGPEFLSWLTDPQRNGGGALMDFGCYGANLSTWLAKGERPLSVTAVTQQLKTDTTYQKVDDEATIIITYSDFQTIIEASWNWPDNRKILKLFGTTGYLECLDAENMRMVTELHPKDMKIPAPKVRAPMDDPFSYFAFALRGRKPVKPTDLAALELNLTVMEILDAARLSAQTGKTVELPQY